MRSRKKSHQSKKRLSAFASQKSESIPFSNGDGLESLSTTESDQVSPKKMRIVEDAEFSAQEMKQDWDPEEEYEVEDIKDVHMDDKEEMLVLIKWRNWSSRTNTWEPLANIKCFEKIIRFLQRHSYDDSYVTALMNHYVMSNLYSPLLNIQTISRLLGVDLSADQCVRLESWEKSSLRETLRKLDPKELRQNILKNFGTEIQFVRSIDSREPMCRLLIELHKTTKAILHDEPPVYFENLVDSEVPPADFKFIKDYVLDEGIIPQSAAIGCSCSDCESDDCQSLHHDCAEQRNYLPDGRLEEWARSQRGPIYECNSACSCPNTCYNRVTQRGRTAEVVVFKTANDRGWGLRTHTPIKAWTFVMEYLGRVVTSATAQESEPTYQFELDFNVDKEAKYVVDAISHGNASHFINHSCNPNMVVVNVWVNDLNPYKPRLAFFACRDIQKHEELTFDYNFKAEASKLKSGMRCRCNEPKCRGRL